MPRLKLTKSAIDALPTPAADTVYWDATSPGFGLKVTPKGRKVFIVIYRTGGAGSRLRKYTIGPYGRVTLHQARVAAQKVFAAKLDGRDPAAEKRAARRQVVADRVEDLLENFIAQRLSQNRSGPEISRLLRREVGLRWKGKSIHQIGKRDVVDLIMAIVERGAPVAANKALKWIKTFFNWCVGRAVLDHSPADGIPAPTKEVARDRVLSDDELGRVILAARTMAGGYGSLVEFLALSGQRREEVARLRWDELDLDHSIWTIPGARTKNGKPHIVHLSAQALALIARTKRDAPFVFATQSGNSVQTFSQLKRALDAACGVQDWCLHDFRRTCVSGMAGLGIPPHIADKILNHQAGTISGVAAVYQRHQFLAERRVALERWGAHLESVILTAHAQALKEAA